MSHIKITPPEPGAIGSGTRITTQDGREIDGVRRAVVEFAPGDLVTAEITASVDVDEIWALPFMSEESFIAAADRYGYEIRKKDAT